jgi:hypothetical protein
MDDHHYRLSELNGSRGGHSCHGKGLRSLLARSASSNREGVGAYADWILDCSRGIGEIGHSQAWSRKSDTSTCS